MTTTYYIERMRAARAQYENEAEKYNGGKMNEDQEILLMRRIAYAARHLSDCLEDLMMHEAGMK